MKKKYKSETFVLGWLDPRDNSIIHAGVGFYKPQYGEYVLKIDEDSKPYFLKPFESEHGRIIYRMEIAIKKRDGRFLKRQVVGFGHRDSETQGNVYIQYGSKFKTLILYLKEYK